MLPGPLYRIIDWTLLNCLSIGLKSIFYNELSEITPEWLSNRKLKTAILYGNMNPPLDGIRRSVVDYVTVVGRISSSSHIPPHAIMRTSRGIWPTTKKIHCDGKDADCLRKPDCIFE